MPTVSPVALRSTLRDGGRWLVSQQQEDGNFATELSAELAPFTPVAAVQITFTAALVLECMVALENSPEGVQCRQRLAQYLWHQKSESWSFNYWPRGSAESHQRPYPDDLDDTFCALAALQHHKRGLLDETALAYIITLLTASEQQEGGPYYTWLVPRTAPAAWHDVDLAVNSNIHYFLSLHDIELPALTRLLETAIAERTYMSAYYPTVYPTAYFIGRGYRGARRTELAAFLLEQREGDGTWGSPLRSALAVTTLLRLGVKLGEVHRAVVALLEQHQRGAWAAECVWLDHTEQGVAYYAGSAALTTAFSLEALALYVARSSAPPLQSELAGSHRETERYQQIWDQVERRWQATPAALREEALALLASTRTSHDQQSMALIPWVFADAFGIQRGRVDEDTLVALGVATVYGWIAYTIYDDFLDEEGKPRLLPVANLALREASQLFGQYFPETPAWQKLFHQIWDEIEAAGVWEVKHARVGQPLVVPDYGDLRHLAQRSAGLSLGALAVFARAGYSVDSPPVQSTQTFFRHFLIARQLLDDAHDWEDDLRRGQINAVGARVLRQSQAQLGPRPLPDKELSAFFWRDVMPGISSTILEQTALARAALEGVAALVRPAPIVAFLEPLEATVRRTVAEQSSVEAFVEAYKNIGVR